MQCTPHNPPNCHLPQARRLVTTPIALRTECRKQRARRLVTGLLPTSDADATPRDSGLLTLLHRHFRVSTQGECRRLMLARPSLPEHQAVPVFLQASRHRQCVWHTIQHPAEQALWTSKGW